MARIERPAAHAPRRAQRLLFGCLLVLASASPPAHAEGRVKAGAAQAWFVLPERVPLAGYSKRQGAPSAGTHDPVGVRALVIQDEDTTVALVSCDLLIIDERLAQAVEQRLGAAGLPGGTTLMLAATHTHSGPGAYGKQFAEKISMGHFQEAVFAELVERITQTIAAAAAQLVPVAVTYQTAATDGLVYNRRDPDGLVDAELRVSAFYPEGRQEPFAVLVNFSAHPTTLGAWNRYLSADYPGVVRRAIERRYPGAACLFFAGAVGDQAPTKQGIGYERAEWIGEALGERVAALLQEASPSVPAGVQALQERLPLPAARVRLGRLNIPRWLGRRLVDDDATLSAVAVDKLVFIGVPCDLEAALGEAVSQAAQSRDARPVLIGFANDYIGYCVTEQRYRTGRYEALMAFNGPTVGPLVVERLTGMLDHLVVDEEWPQW